jgi:hypothetical protein
MKRDDLLGPAGGGNNLRFHLMGVASITVVPGGSDMMAAMQDVANRVAADGATPYTIPGGASKKKRWNVSATTWAPAIHSPPPV